MRLEFEDTAQGGTSVFYTVLLK